MYVCIYVYTYRNYVTAMAMGVCNLHTTNRYDKLSKRPEPPLINNPASIDNDSTSEALKNAEAGDFEWKVTLMAKQY